MNLFSFVPFILQTIMWVIVRPALAFFVRIRIQGRKNIPRIRGGVILAVNHLSDFDPILIPSTLGPFSWMMPVFSASLEKSFYKDTPLGPRPWFINFLYGGTFFKMLGAYPVLIGTKGDYERSLQNHIRLLERGETVGIFPEGRRNKDGEVGEGKPGVAYLVWRTGCPVVPVAIHGHYKMHPQDFFARKHSITISYGKPITRAELFGKKFETIQPSRDELKDVTQIIMSHIRKMYKRS